MAVVTFLQIDARVKQSFRHSKDHHVLERVQPARTGSMRRRDGRFHDLSASPIVKLTISDACYFLKPPYPCSRASPAECRSRGITPPCTAVDTCRRNRVVGSASFITLSYDIYNNAHEHSCEAHGREAVVHSLSRITWINRQ